MAGPGVYERRRFEKERRRLAEKMADMPSFQEEGTRYFVDQPWEKITGQMPASDYDAMMRQVARRDRQRTKPKAEVGITGAPSAGWWPGATAAPTVSATTPTVGVTAPQATVAAQPAPQAGVAVGAAPTLTVPTGYQRWRGAGETMPPQYEGWGQWYKPEGKVKDQPHLAVINRLLPFLAEEDVEAVARQLYTAGKGAAGPFATYLQSKGLGQPVLGPAPTGTPAEPAAVLEQLWGILSGIKDATARAWAQSVFDIYRDWTPTSGLRTSMEESVFKSQLGELMENIPEAAQPYAGVIERLVMPTVRYPAQEWYELPEYARTAPTNWRALDLTTNPAWM